MSEFQLYDIAGALARQCRYGGHCMRFYSVAEHCVLVASKASDKNKFTALMHDASEAYLVDIPRPIKNLLPDYQRIEKTLMRALSDRFDFDYPLPEEVKQLDEAILTDEREQNMAPLDAEGEEWGNKLPALGVELRCWAPEKAAYEFGAAFRRYGGRV
jgi:hypothetical protein